MTPKRDSARVVGPDADALPSGATGPAAVDSSADESEAVASSRGVPRPSRRAIQLAAARRRRVFLVLVALTLIVAAVSWAGLIPVWSAAVPAALLVVFLVVARRHVRRVNAALRRRPVADQQAEESAVVASGAVRVDATHGSTRSAGAQAVVETTSSMDHRDGEPTVKIRTSEGRVSQADAPTEHFGGWASRAAGSRAANTPVVAGRSMLPPGDGSEPAAAVTAPAADEVAPVVVADGASLWDPLPVTLPTYVDKTVARRTVRRIQLGEVGTWTSGHSEADSQTVAKAESEAADDVARTDDPASRAVNG